MTVYLFIFQTPDVPVSFKSDVLEAFLCFRVSRGRKEENVTGSHHAVAAREALLSRSTFMDALQRLKLNL